MPGNHSGFQLTGVAIYKTASTFGDDDTTPSVVGGNVFKCATGHSGATDVTTFNDGTSGQMIIIIGANPTHKTTIKDGSDLYINGDWVEEAEATLTLIYDGSYWYELCRRHS